MSYLVPVPLHHCSYWLTSLLRHGQSTQGASLRQRTSQETARTPGNVAEQFWKTPCSSGSETTSSPTVGTGDSRKQLSSSPLFQLKSCVTNTVLPKYSYSASLELQTLYMDTTLCCPTSSHPAWQCPIRSAHLSAIIAKACKIVSQTARNGNFEIYPLIRDKALNCSAHNLH